MAIQEKEDGPGDNGHGTCGDQGGQGRGSDGDWFDREPTLFVFVYLGDVRAIVVGFGERLFGLVNVLFGDLEFLDTGVFPDAVLELQFKRERKG